MHSGTGRTLLRGTVAAAAVLAASLGAASPSAAGRIQAGPAGPTRHSGPANPALAVVPFPGTPDASPLSQVIFSTLRPGDLSRVMVTGTRSGLHAGRLEALPAGAGAAFVPRHRFAPGERITVVARLRSARAATAAGDPGERTLRFSFRTARDAPQASPPSARETPQASPPPSSPAGRTSGGHPRSSPWQSFRSEPRLHPPFLRLDRTDPPGGDIFVTPTNSGQLGPMIINGHGRLVWFHHTGRATAFNFEKQSYHGRPVLTWWQGSVEGGHGVNGRDVILDRSYRRVAVLRGGYGHSSDLHEFQLASHGRALIDEYYTVPADLSSVGGPRNGRVLDCVIQELDVKTGRVLWEWHAYGHVPLSASYNWVPTGQTPFDFFHLNSIQQLAGNRLIISARNTWSVYMIDQRTGRVIWTLGGKYPSFRMGGGTNFEWQHDARLHRHGILTVFDDAGVPPEEPESSAKEMRIDLGSGVVSLVRRFTHNPPLLAGSQGNAQLLGNGNMMVGWGPGGGFSEFTPRGREVLDGRFRLGVNTYRAYRYSWTAHPAHPPALAAVPAPNGSVRLFASWNGATQVASWEVLGGPARHKLIPLTARSVGGFETAMRLYNQPRFFAVRALNGRGGVIGRSFNIPVPSHVAIFGRSAFANMTTRFAALPVGCFAHSECHVIVQVTAGSSAIGPPHPVTVPAGRTVLVAFKLSPAGLRKLSRAAHGQLSVRVGVRRTGGAGASRRLTLVRYSTSGPSPVQSVAQAPTIQLVGTSELVSSQGRGGILASCYGAAPCEVDAVMSAGGKIIANPGVQYMGENETAYIPFLLNAAGRSMLGHAPGNQLAARVTLTNHNSEAGGRVVLSRHA